MAIQNISVFRSTDGGMTQAGATTGRMSGTAGDRIGLLNSILLNGYNWQEVTAANLTQSGNVASLTLTGHGFNKYQRLWCIGMDHQGYLNGTTYGDALYPATVPDANTLTFAVTGSPTSPTTASGSTTASTISSTTTTSITVASAASFPNFPFVIKIDSEYMLVTAGFGTTTWTVVRGFAASTAATHSNNATVTQKILIGVAPAGGFTHWTADYTAANKSTYRAPVGNRMWLDVDDSNTTYALVRGYETMTAVGTGTGPFPTTTQVAAGQTYVPSASAANTTARPWVAIASDRFVLLHTDTQSAVVNISYCGFLFFGDLISQTKAGDAYGTALIHSTTTAGANDATMCNMSNSAIAGHYSPRSYTQVGSSINCNKQPTDIRAYLSYSGAGGMSFPHPPDGGIYMCQMNWNEGSQYLSRGILPAMWVIMHNRPFQHLDVIVGSGALSGKTFLTLHGYNGGEIAVEISNTVLAP